LVDHVAVGAQAQASLDPGGAAECGLCVIGTGTTHDLQNGGVTVHGAGIHLNGTVRVASLPDGARVQGVPDERHEHQPIRLSPLFGTETGMDLDEFVSQCEQAWQVFVTGDPGPARLLFSRRDDVTLANPWGPAGNRMG
jgi:hypothetical protein